MSTKRFSVKLAVSDRELYFLREALMAAYPTDPPPEVVALLAYLTGAAAYAARRT